MPGRASGKVLGGLVGVLVGLALAAGAYAALEPDSALRLAGTIAGRFERLTSVRVVLDDPSRGAVETSSGPSGQSRTTSGTPTAPKPAAAAGPAAPAVMAAPTPRHHSYETLKVRLRSTEEAGLRRIAYASDADSIRVTQSFRFQGRRQRVSFRVTPADLDWARGRDLVGVVRQGESQRDFSGRLWREAIDDRHERQLYDTLTASLRALRDQLGLGPDEYAELIASYVQEMPYDYAAALQTSSTRHPIVTAVDGTGVCADKSLLMAGLLQHEGFRVVLLDFLSESHMAVGLKVGGSGYRGTGYAFVEATSLVLVGEVGKGYGPSGSVKLSSAPHVTRLDPSGRAYGAAKETAFILERLASYREAYDVYRTRLSGLGWDPLRYNEVVTRLNRCADVLNTANRHADDREALYVWMAALAKR
jgi:hypothetical protein